MAKLMPAFQKVTLAGADETDETSLNMTSDLTDTTYGGDLFFNLTRFVRLRLPRSQNQADVRFLA